MLKDYLLELGCFIDNEYLDKYLELIEKPNIFLGYCELHHIIPIAYYKIKFNCANRKQAEKFSLADNNNKLVNLLFKDHCYAHWLLANCTTGSLQNSMITAFLWMTNNPKNLITLIDADLVEIQNWKNNIINNSATFYWTTEQIIWLKQNWEKLSLEECANYLNKSVTAVYSKCKRLKLVYNKTAYSIEEKTWLNK